MIYGNGMRFGKSGCGKSHFVRGEADHYYSLDYVKTMLAELVVERPVPPELAWTKMNTGWNKKRGKND